MITLDGSIGEGGGQILRSSLTLAILTSQPFKIQNIRAKRPNPGLRPAHVMAVKAAARISAAQYKGASVGSSTLYFEPGKVQSGRYHLEIGTAGATSLVLQTIVLPLALRGTEPSEVTITGGTHVANSPCYHYLEVTWACFLHRLGLPLTVEMIRPGFYPRGGGKIRAVISPCSLLEPLRLRDCPTLTTAGGFSAVAGLPRSIAERQALRLKQRLKAAGIDCHIPIEEWGSGPGTVAAVIFRQAPVPVLFFSIGEPGKPAEWVADEAVDAALAFRERGAPVDPYAADQLLLPLLFSRGPSMFRSSEITQHLITNIGVIQAFFGNCIRLEGELGEPGTITVEPRSEE